MLENQVRKFYTQMAKFYQRFFVGWLGWEKELDAFFAENDFLRPEMKILDAGCGTGPVTKALYFQARRKVLENVAFFGFDLTPAMLDLFQQWIEKEKARGIHLIQADVLELANQLPEDWRDFDWVVSSAMLEYIPEESRILALQNLKALLNPGGRLLLFLTQRTRLTRWTGAKWWGTRLFDRDEIEFDLEQAGFQDVQFRKLPKGWDAFMMAVEAGMR